MSALFVGLDMKIGVEFIELVFTSQIRNVLSADVDNKVPANFGFQAAKTKVI